MPNPLDLKGKQFGKLTVVRLAKGRTKQGDRLWHCKCECGESKIARAGKLRSGQTTCCGGCKRRTRDLSGTRHGMLTVLHLEKERSTWKKPCRLWHCKCDCGGEKFVPTEKLTATSSCGCQFRSPVVDLVGKRFGNLTVVARAKGQSKVRDRLWQCKCSCGKKKIVRTGDLKSEHVGSCGCAKQGNPRYFPRRGEMKKRFKNAEVVTVKGRDWFALRKFRSELDIGSGTARRWTKYCKWLNRAVATKPLRDGMGATRAYLSAEDAESISKARESAQHIVPGPSANRITRNGRFTDQPLDVQVAAARVTKKRRRGRPVGTTDSDVARRKAAMLAAWDKGVYGKNKSKAGRANDFDRSNATKLINEHERAKCSN